MPPPVNWMALIRKYASPGVPLDVRTDIGALVAYARAMAEENERLKQELRGATQTMLAITKTCGVVELPFALIDTLNEKDKLKATDVNGPHGAMKRFEYIPYRPPEAVDSVH